MPILVTGAKGQLGGEFCARLGDRALGVDQAQLDLMDQAAIESIVTAVEPEAVIHCAAYNAVDRAETDRERCFRINADAVATLAKVTRRLGVPLVQISTDYVFGGDAARRTPYCETDAPGPLGVYAESKLAGEQAATANPRHLILRTCGLYAVARRGQTITNFVQTMLRLGRERDRVRVVNDQTCSPTYVPNLAAAALYLLDRLLDGALHGPVGPGACGLFHVVDAGAITWHEMAVEIFRQANLDVHVEPITTAEYHAPAPRPAYSVLSAARYHATGGPAMPAWKDGIAAYLAASST
jgi:dTDP-4-dehydrorhamnose reductase